MKAMGVGLWRFNLRDVEVARAQRARRLVHCTARPPRSAEAGHPRWLVDVSAHATHRKAIAIAL